MIASNEKKLVIIDEIQKLPVLLNEVHYLIENLSQFRGIEVGSECALSLTFGHDGFNNAVPLQLRIDNHLFTFSTAAEYLVCIENLQTIDTHFIPNVAHLRPGKGLKLVYRTFISLQVTGCILLVIAVDLPELFRTLCY